MNPIKIIFTLFIISVTSSQGFTAEKQAEAKPNELRQQTEFDGTFHHVTSSGLAKPLLYIVAPNGFLGCGYFNVETCDKTKEACAIVTGVNSTEEMQKAEVKKVSQEAAKLGIKVGMTGKEALMLMKKK